MIKVFVHHNGKLIKTYQFEKETISLGRLATNDIPINSMAVSRNHMLIEYNMQDRKVTVSDRDSLNGVYLNQQKISSVEINQDSLFTIGEYAVLIEFGEVPVPMVNANVTEELPVQEDAVSAEAPSEEEMVKLPSDTYEENQSESGMFFSASKKTKSEPEEEVVEEEEEEKIDNSKAVLIELDKQIIYKVNKRKMTFGNNKNNDIYIEGGVFTAEKIATLRVNESQYELTASNKIMGRFKVNGKKVAQCILKHKDKIEIGSSTFSFMLKDE